MEFPERYYRDTKRTLRKERIRDVWIAGDHGGPVDTSRRMGVSKRGGVQRELAERQPGKLVQPLGEQREQQRVRLRERRERGDRRGGWTGFVQRERQRESRLGRRRFHRRRVLPEASQQQQRAERSAKIGEPGVG